MPSRYLKQCRLIVNWTIRKKSIKFGSKFNNFHVRQCFDYSDVIIRAMASQITGVWIVHSAVCSGADERKHKSSASPAFVRRIHRRPVNSPHKGPVTRKMFPFDYVIMRHQRDTKNCMLWMPPVSSQFVSDKHVSLSRIDFTYMSLISNISIVLYQQNSWNKINYYNIGEPVFTYRKRLLTQRFAVWSNQTRPHLSNGHEHHEFHSNFHFSMCIWKCRLQKRVRIQYGRF